MDKYYIPQHLDEPFRLILWTLDEFVVFLAPFVLCLFFLNSPLIGLFIGACLLFGLKRLKGEQGHYFIYNLAYWYCPVFIRLKATPPSYQRTLLG